MNIRRARLYLRISNALLTLAEWLCAVSGKLNICAAKWTGKARGMIGVMENESRTADP